jgi:hypothetical protein
MTILTKEYMTRYKLIEKITTREQYKTKNASVGIQKTESNTVTCSIGFTKLICTCTVACKTIDLGPLTKKSNSLNLSPSKSMDYLQYWISDLLDLDVNTNSEE